MACWTSGSKQSSKDREEWDSTVAADVRKMKDLLKIDSLEQGDGCATLRVVLV